MMYIEMYFFPYNVMTSRLFYYSNHVAAAAAATMEWKINLNPSRKTSITFVAGSHFSFDVYETVSERAPPYPHHIRRK